MARSSLLICYAVLLLLIPPSYTWAQTTHVHVHQHHHAARPLAANVIIPQRAVISSSGSASTAVAPRAARTDAVRIKRVDVSVAIVEQVAITTLEITLQNPTSRRLEAEVILPVPAGAAVRGFNFQGAGKEPSAELLTKEEARRIYDSIVAKIRDPALLEFIGYNLIRSSVFPVEARGSQKVRLSYESICTAENGRVDYVLPRSESLEYTVPWSIQVSVKSRRSVATVYSPSHTIDKRITDAGHTVSVRTARGSETEPGPFRLSLLVEKKKGVSASLLAYPDPSLGGGYFLLLAGIPPRTSEVAPEIKREVTLVLDRSGSMAGEKIQQVRNAAGQVIAGLKSGESFNVICYNEAVDVFSTRPVIKDEANERAACQYLKGTTARGGTNIHDALVEALRQKPTKNQLPIVLFLTDGRPTIGQTKEKDIRDAVKAANRHDKRVFTFGVGLDVNTPLVEDIAWDTRATATFVLPREDVELKVANLFRKLSGPILVEPELAIVEANGERAVGRVRDLVPTRLADVFNGDQLVLLGQYVGEEPLRFQLSGNYLGKSRTFRFKFDLDKATTRNAFVPRLWAQRKIGVLIDAIRSSGADSTAIASGNVDPKMKELVDEVVRLSIEFGILTEYTAFLAREGTDLSGREQVFSQAWNNFDSRARQTRSGLGAVNQELNAVQQKSAGTLNYRNAYWDAHMNRIQISQVQQVADRAFYRKGNRWIDSRVVDGQQPQYDRVIDFGSPEFLRLARDLAKDNRQGSIMMRGDIVLQVNGQRVLVRNH
ncbi:MAG: VIT and vWA domain-containing protein [bacterium]